MRISNKSGETLTIEPGDHVDVESSMIRKNEGMPHEVVVEEQR